MASVPWCNDLQYQPHPGPGYVDQMEAATPLSPGLWESPCHPFRAARWSSHLPAFAEALPPPLLDQAGSQPTPRRFPQGHPSLTLGGPVMRLPSFLFWPFPDVTIAYDCSSYLLREGDEGLGGQGLCRTSFWTP